jgi:hypothetical protein
LFGCHRLGCFMTLAILCHLRDGFATSFRKYTGCA